MNIQAPTTTPNAFLSINHIEVFYGEFQALFGVSMTVDRGETVAIIGANGAGKTTLMRAIAGQLTPATGDISYQGRAIAQKNAYEMNRLGIALVPEGRKIFPSLTVEENLKIGGYARRSGEWTSFMIFIVVIGGIGTVIFFLLWEYMADFGEWSFIILGAIAVIMMLVAPQGVWGLIKARFNWEIFPLRRQIGRQFADGL